MSPDARFTGAQIAAAAARVKLAHDGGYEVEPWVQRLAALGGQMKASQPGKATVEDGRKPASGPEDPAPGRGRAKVYVPIGSTSGDRRGESLDLKPSSHEHFVGFQVKGEDKIAGVRLVRSEQLHELPDVQEFGEPMMVFLGVDVVDFDPGSAHVSTVAPDAEREADASTPDSGTTGRGPATQS